MRTGLGAVGLTLALASGPAPAAADGVAIHVDVVAGHARRDDHPHRFGARGHRGADRAWQRGYERGLDHGERWGRRDARTHRGYEPWRHSRDRKATSGDRSRFGPRPAYRDGYRDGFVRAYRRAFEAHHRHGRRDRCDDGRPGRRHR